MPVGPVVGVVAVAHKAFQVPESCALDFQVVDALVVLVQVAGMEVLLGLTC